MRKRILIAAILGFIVPIVYGFIEMLFFNAQDTLLVEFFAGWLPRILCPAWMLADGSAFWFIAIPFLNAATYALIAYLLLQTKKILHVGQ